jgi:hypothetical protein
MKKRSHLLAEAWMALQEEQEYYALAKLAFLRSVRTGTKIVTRLICNVPIDK